MLAQAANVCLREVKLSSASVTSAPRAPAPGTCNGKKLAVALLAAVSFLLRWINTKVRSVIKSIT